jgi:hypothetical protein
VHCRAFLITKAKKICNKWYEFFETNQIDLSGNHKVEGQIQNLKHKKKYNKRVEKEKSKETQNAKKSLQKTTNKSHKLQ